jgi:putative YhbY family RNA-binding protein
LLELDFFSAAYTLPMTPLSPSRRSELRSQAHTLSPVVIVGDKGLTDEVIAEIDRSLKAHELIKVRAAAADRDARGTWMATICEKLSAHAVQQIGKVLVIYRENFDKPRERKLAPGPPARRLPGQALPRRGARGDEAKRPRAGVRDDKTAVKRSARPRSRTPSPRPESAPRRRRPRSSR